MLVIMMVLMVLMVLVVLINLLMTIVYNNGFFLTAVP